MGLKRSAQGGVAAVLVLLGMALLLYMILVEDEPGAIPLAMIVGGSLWLWLMRRRER